MTTKEYDELRKLYEALKVEKAIAERDRDKYKEKKDEYKKKLGEQSSSSVPSDYEEQKRKAEKYKEYKNAFGGKSADEIKRELTEAKEEEERLKKKLERKKEKIEKLRKSPQQSAGIDSKSLEFYKERADDLEKKLAKWIYLFPDQEPEKLKEFAEKARGYEENFKELERKLELAKKGSVSEDINKISAEIREVATKYVELGKEAGGFLLSPIGGLIGAGLATTHGFMAVGVYACENTRRSIQEVVEKSMDSGVDIYKTTADKVQWWLGKSGDDIKEMFKDLAEYRKLKAERKVQESEAKAKIEAEFAIEQDKLKTERSKERSKNWGKLAEGVTGYLTADVDKLKEDVIRFKGEIEVKNERIKKLEEIEGKYITLIEQRNK